MVIWTLSGLLLVSIGGPHVEVGTFFCTANSLKRRISICLEHYNRKAGFDRFQRKVFLAGFTTNV